MRKPLGRSAALAALVLGLGACSKKEEPAPAAPPAARPGPAPQGAGPAEPRLRRLLEKPAVEEAPPPPPITALPDTRPPPKDFAAGQPQSVVMRLLGDCGERVYYRPPGPGSLVVEIVQPRAGECRERLGERRFTLVGGVLESITPGVLPPPRPPRPAPEGV
jgi:hypothetical protein